MVFIAAFIMVSTSFLPFTNATTNETNYYAVIVAIYDYNGTKYDLHVPVKNILKVYNGLLKWRNWKKENIKLLVNENATHDNILNALDWLASKSNKNDIILFLYNGHGTEIKDENGDEEDGYDEAIVPWELNKNSLISDDVLAEKFNEIKAKGMAILLDCCLSGGFIEDLGNATFQKGIKEDIKADGRIILTSSYDSGLSLGLRGWGTPCTNFFGYAINHGTYFLHNNVSSAEDIFKFTKIANNIFWPIFFRIILPLVDVVMTLSIETLLAFIKVVAMSITQGILYGMALSFYYITSLILITPLLILEAHFASTVAIILEEVMAYIETGHWILPFAFLYDGYEGEMPLLLK